MLITFCGTGPLYGLFVRLSIAHTHAHTRTHTHTHTHTHTLTEESVNDRLYNPIMLFMGIKIIIVMVLVQPFYELHV